MACSICGFSIPELEPRIFSFNSPSGACMSCDGLGTKAEIDINKVVSKPEFSLNQGAIRGMGYQSYVSALPSKMCQ